MDCTREEWISHTKAVAILLVVIAHMFRGLISANLYNSAGFKYIDFTLASFLMPLYFILSGYLYAKTKQINCFSKYKKNAFNNVLNLGIPYFVFTIVQATINIFLSSKTNGTVSVINILRIPISPLFQFWFLYALLIVLLIIPLLELWFKNQYLILAILIILKLASPYVVTNIYLIDSFCVNAFYFYMGKILYLKNKTIVSNHRALTFFSLIYVFLNILVYTKFSYIHNSFIINILEITLALTGSLFVIFVTSLLCTINNFIVHILNIIGKYSFHIYLLHVIPMAGIRIILSKILKLDNLVLHATLGLVFGIGFPILVGYIAYKISMLNFFFHPTKYIHRGKENSIKIIPSVWSQ
ncbi:acyltransferase [Clostridium bowmanii]|uniref:acyltransferase family protein n=1 Tax=Clostridium bowmanii TaxID=132925 RepID=UPI001C0C94A2|nr:acyltransferase [Clostridium bowmanii]MBU3191206.1 acyltransferase [Clostridium bowmanii]MCA1075654.1 acyltransferase [Clostridium bowmanii]